MNRVYRPTRNQSRTAACGITNPGITNSGAELHPFQNSDKKNNISNHRLIRRRDFLLILASLACLPTLDAFAGTDPKYNKLISKEPWTTLDAVFQHLFPADENTPGAREIQVLNYIQTMLNTPDADPNDITFLSNGVGWLNDLSQQLRQQKFTSLNESERENILRKIESSDAGERWLSYLLTQLLEALLSDPAYGSNPSGIGWQWLQHPAGYPLPNHDTLYFKLAARVKRNNKA